jgi:hypothetical protein
VKLKLDQLQLRKLNIILGIVKGAISFVLLTSGAKKEW